MLTWDNMLPTENKSGCRTVCMVRSYLNHIHKTIHLCKVWIGTKRRNSWVILISSLTCTVIFKLFFIRSSICCFHHHGNNTVFKRQLENLQGNLQTGKNYEGPHTWKITQNNCIVQQNSLRITDRSNS